MAYRVDDIVVTEKNVMLLHDGHQYIADIEKEKEITNTFNKSRDSNPWNLRTSDGYTISNLFELSSFTVRTQVVTGSSGASVNYKQSHERFFMPNGGEYLGLCQFYDNSYSITDRTDRSFSSTYSTTAGTDTGTYESDGSFIRYEKLSSYDNMVDYYITPDTAFIPVCGVQYLTEYPLNAFYSDFGDNENSDYPTVYGDSCPLKYYLNDEYSVESTFIDDAESDFSLRTYYGIGNTGNSIYLVYRNDVNGSAVLSSNGGIYVPTVKYSTEDYIIRTGIGAIGYMTNVVTVCDEDDKVMYASDPYSDFFEYTSLESVKGFSFIKQPKDHSFILYFKHSDGKTEIIFVPRNGLEKSKYVKTLTGTINESSVIELSNTVVMASPSDGILVADSRTYGNDDASTDISLKYSPFTNAYMGRPSSESLSAIDSACGFSDIALYWNGNDILAAIAHETVDGTKKGIALLSTASYSEDGTAYETGRYFMRAAVPSYEIDVSTVNEYSPYTTVVSSVPSSYESGGETIITYYLKEVQTREITASYEVSSFNTATNRVVNGYDIIFDYSPVEIDGEVELGSYAFIQFSGYGLAKCHASDIFRNDDFIRTTSTGPANINANLLANSICKGVHFDFISYNEDSRKRANDILDYIGVNDNSNRIYGKPALYTTYISGSSRWYNTFSAIPFSDAREIITEPTFSSSTAQRSVEYDSLTSCQYMLDEYIGNSYGVNVRTVEASGINHDASIALVKWNQSNGIYSSSNDYTLSSTSVGGLHLQYNAICTELLVKGTNRTLEDGTSSYTSTVYEYPHPCFGELVTAGTGIHIFDGELSGSMTNDDIFMLNGYLIVKNYAVKNMEINVNSVDETTRRSGKSYSHETGEFQTGGYVITNFFLGGESNISSLYDSKLVSSSKVKSKTSNLSETIYDYSYLWHVIPSKPIEFYPESKTGSNWTPFYSNTYVDFIKYHNGYYYIALSRTKDKNSKTEGYDIIETDDLFTESEITELKTGTYVSDIGFFDDNVAVEYTNAEDGSVYTLWFKQGKSESKTYPMGYCNTTSYGTDSLSSVNRAVIELTEDMKKTEARAMYDNVEIIHSMNRFSSVVSHKSNMFSIKITDLGLDESPYLTETQKKNLRMWFKNRITTIVDSVKPANTQLFDVFID